MKTTSSCVLNSMAILDAVKAARARFCLSFTTIPDKSRNGNRPSTESHQFSESAPIRAGSSRGDSICMTATASKYAEAAIRKGIM
jgi:hypothetical protein